MPISEKLLDTELFWAENYTYLLEQGFLLRPRYSPGWKPSWILPDGSKRPEPVEIFEDAHVTDTTVHFIIDATRLSDSAQVVLRKANTNKAEYLMLKKLNSPELQCSANHTVPLLDVLSLPGSDDTVLLVMPKLLSFSYPRFETRGEIVEAICQIIESIAFMHSLNIAHGDISSFSMMMDASRVCYEGFHFARDDTVDGSGPEDTLKYRPRHEVMPVSYYVITFRSAKHFPDGHDTRIDPLYVDSALRSSPELYQGKLVDPFALDLYNLGHAFCLMFYGYTKVDDLLALFYPLVHDDPKERPDAHTVLEAIRALVEEKGRAWLDEPILREHYSGF